MIRLAGVLAVAAAVFCAGASRAQTPPAEPFPYDRLATSVVAIAPPAHWRAEIDVIDDLVEIGEFSPQGEGRMFWRNQLGYFTNPVGGPGSAANLGRALDGVARGCAAIGEFSIRPRHAGPSEQWGEVACLSGLMGEGTPSAPIAIFVFKAMSAGDGEFQFWRAWRGSSAEAAAFFAPHGAPRAPLLPAAPTSADFETWRPAIAALVENIAAEMNAAFSVCDLGGRPCPALHIAGARPAAPGAIARVSVRGPAPHDADLAAATLDFRSRAAAAQVSAAIAAAQGGGVSISGAANPAEAARIRAYILRLGRAAMSADLPYDALSYDLWP